jgi:hypothetical protein
LLFVDIFKRDKDCHGRVEGLQNVSGGAELHHLGTTWIKDLTLDQKLPHHCRGPQDDEAPHHLGRAKSFWSKVKSFFQGLIPILFFPILPPPRPKEMWEQRNGHRPRPRPTDSGGEYFGQSVQKAIVHQQGVQKHREFQMSPSGNLHGSQYGK